MNRLFSIFNPFSSKYNSLQNFKKLNRPQKIAIGVISSAVAIVTLPIFGIGICLGTAIFRSLTERSISKKSNEDKDAKKISKVSNRSLTHSSPKIATQTYTPDEFIELLIDPEKQFPKGKIIVTGDLDLNTMKISELPMMFEVKGTLNLSGNMDISKLPKGIKVGGNLNLSDNTKIKKLPEGIKVGGNLNLSFTKISELPEGLKVGGYLNASYTNISELPEKIKVGGELDLSNTNISKLPNWVMKLGAKKNGEKRIIFLGNAKLSDDIIAELRNKNIPGIKFYF